MGTYDNEAGYPLHDPSFDQDPVCSIDPECSCTEEKLGACKLEHTEAWILYYLGCNKFSGLDFSELANSLSTPRESRGKLRAKLIKLKREGKIIRTEGSGRSLLDVTREVKYMVYKINSKAHARD